VPIVLVGNKCDIPEREVTTAQGQELANSFGVPYFESSAKERLNVEESFHELVSAKCNCFVSVFVRRFIFDPFQVRQVKASRAPAPTPSGPAKPANKKKACSIL
jgi:hypothetical protein